MMPSLFVAHGAPLLAIEENEYTTYLGQLGKTLERPTAVVLFSAHWESQTQQVSHVDGVYETIYDFGGFPPELYRIQYPAVGAPNVAQEVERLLTAEGIDVKSETRRGLDHGAWVVLRLMYPDANIPVVSMSVNPRLSPAEQYRIGQVLAPLRERGVLIIGSGGTVHNLRALRMVNEPEETDAFATDFDNWLELQLQDWNLDALYDYREQAPGAQMAVPAYGNEHFIPLFYAMGAADDSRHVRLLHRNYRYGNLSQSIWQFS